MRHAFGFVGDAGLAECLGDASIDVVGVFPSGGTEDKLEVAPNGAISEQLKVLEDDAEAATQSGCVAKADAVQVVSHDGGLATGYGQLGVEGAQETAFARSDTSDDVNKLTAEEREGGVAEDDIAVQGQLHVFESHKGIAFHFYLIRFRGNDHFFFGGKGK